MKISKSVGRIEVARAAVVLAVFAALPAAAQYSARQEADVVHLEDAKNHTVVSVITSVGNIAYEMKVNGTNVIYFASDSLDDFRQSGGATGIPFLGPWANRLDEPAFYANGKSRALIPILAMSAAIIPCTDF